MNFSILDSWRNDVMACERHSGKNMINTSHSKVKNIHIILFFQFHPIRSSQNRCLFSTVLDDYQLKHKNFVITIYHGCEFPAKNLNEESFLYMNIQSWKYKILTKITTVFWWTKRVHFPNSILDLFSSIEFLLVKRAFSYAN